MLPLLLATLCVLAAADCGDQACSSGSAAGLEEEDDEVVMVQLPPRSSSGPHAVPEAVPVPSPGAEALEKALETMSHRPAFVQLSSEVSVSETTTPGQHEAAHEVSRMTSLLAMLDNKAFLLILEVSLLVAALLALAVAAAMVPSRFQRPRSAVWQKAAKLKVTTGQDLKRLFSAPAAEEAAADEQDQDHMPLNPGILMRLKGRVAASCASLSAPLSSQPCAMYCASVSQQRQDGVHQPPLAFRTAASDFRVLVEVADGEAPVPLMVCGADVNLFDVSVGLFGASKRLEEASEAWRGFALAHLVQGFEAKAAFDLSATGAVLDFRESSLLVGAEVTCVGEVARDAGGALTLCPWRQPLDYGSTAGWSAPSWEAVGTPASRTEKNPLAGQVLISDCPTLLSTVPTRMTLGSLFRKVS